MQGPRRRLMGSFSPEQDLLVLQIKETARTVAYRERLPWDLRALRQAGLRAARAQWEGYRVKKEELGGVSFEEYAQGAIEKEMLATAKRLRAEAADGGKTPPPEEEIEEAIGEFTAKEWRDPNPEETPEQRKARMERTGLARSFSRPEVKAVRSYVYGDSHTPEERKQREKELEQRFGTKKVRAFLSGLVLRDTELWLEEHRP